MTTAIPSCGCLPGSEYTGWQEIRSTYCQAEERRLFRIFLMRGIHNEVSSSSQKSSKNTRGR